MPPRTLGGADLLDSSRDPLLSPSSSVPLARLSSIKPSLPSFFRLVADPGMSFYENCLIRKGVQASDGTVKARYAYKFGMWNFVNLRNDRLVSDMANAIINFMTMYHTVTKCVLIVIFTLIFYMHIQKVKYLIAIFNCIFNC